MPLQQQTFSKPYTVNEERIDDALLYLQALVDQTSTTIQFKTGAGHIFFDLMKKLPSLNNYENQKIAVCKKIASLTYPLAYRLMARGVAFTITVSGTPLSVPLKIDALATVVFFDVALGQCRHCFTIYNPKKSSTETLLIPKGMTVIAEPLEYHYHQLKDDRVMHPRHAGSALPSQEWYNRQVEKPSNDMAMPAKAYTNFGVLTPGIQGVAQPNDLKVFKNLADAVATTAVTEDVPIPAPLLELPKGQNYFEFQPRAQRYWRHQLILEQAQKEAELELGSPHPEPPIKNPSATLKPGIKNSFQKLAKLFPRLTLNFDPYQDN